MNPLVPLALAAALGYYLLTKEEEPASAPETRPPLEGGPPPPQVTMPPAGVTAPPGTVAAPPPSGALTTAAQRLATIATSGSCDDVSRATWAFQRQAAMEGRRVAPDGKYGAQTRGLLQQVLQTPPPAATWVPGGKCWGKPAAGEPAPGQAPIVSTTSSAALRDRMSARINDGTDAFNTGNWTEAVKAFKDAGWIGLQLGPVIDVQTSGRSKPQTGRAWQRNAQLQAVNKPTPVRVRDVSHPTTLVTKLMGKAATPGDAALAQQLVIAMLGDYDDARRQFGVSGVGRYGTGATPQQDLIEQMRARLGSAIAAKNQGRYKDAIDGFKDAGWFGVQQVGPALDQLGGRTKEFTQQAWQMNGQLQAVGKQHMSPYWPTTFDKIDAEHAHGNANVMLRNYDAALAQAMGDQQIASASGHGTGNWWTGQMEPQKSAQELLSGMQLILGSGDAAFGIGSFDQAVEAFKMAARQGAQWVGPAIDAQMQGATAALTRQAAAEAQRLQSIPSTISGGRPASQTDAQTAQGGAHNVFTLLRQALGRAASAGTAMWGYRHATGARPMWGFGTSGPMCGFGTGGGGPMWGYGHATGIGTVIPSMYKPHSDCYDASSDAQLCAAVASALATETDMNKLVAFGTSVQARGFPRAALALMAKAGTMAGAP